MFKNPANKKKPVRSFDSRLIHKGKSYTSKEIAEVYGIDESVVHRWRREEGLIPLDDKAPALFHFENFKINMRQFKTELRKLESYI